MRVPTAICNHVGVVDGFSINGFIDHLSRRTILRMSTLVLEVLEFASHWECFFLFDDFTE